MIDIHCHILPGIDDGPQHIEETVEMARLAASDGITDIIATPHINGNYPATAMSKALKADGLEKYVLMINRKIRAAGLPLRIRPGAEIAHHHIDSADLATLGMNRTRYLLIEFPHTHLPVNAGDLIFKLVIGGYRPIIAHPERNPSVIDNPKKLKALRGMGALVQITAASLTRADDPDVRRCVHYLLKKGDVDFIASDAHSAVARPPILSEAFNATKRLLGAQQATVLLRINPLSVLKGRPVHGA